MHCVKLHLSYDFAMESLYCTIMGYIRKFSNMRVALRQLARWVEFFHKLIRMAKSHCGAKACPK